MGSLRLLLGWPLLRSVQYPQELDRVRAVVLGDVLQDGLAVCERHGPPSQLEPGAAQREDLAAALPAGLVPAFLTRACRRAAIWVRAWSLLRLGRGSSIEACT